MSNNALWSGRFDAEPDAEVFAYGKSLPVDRRLIDDDIAGSIAWSEALARAMTSFRISSLTLMISMMAVRPA